MNGPMRKDLFRSIKKSIVRFVSLVAIVALGISFFVGIKSASPDMRKTANEYFVENNLLDVCVVSTIGFTDDEVKKISQVENVDAVQAVKFTDTLVFVDGRGIVNVENGAAMACRVTGMDFSVAKQFSKTGKAEPTYMNRVKLVDGRYPENRNECVVDYAIAQSYPEFSLGSTITLSGDGSNLSDILNKEEFVIVGTVSSPMYVSFERGTTLIGSGTLGMFLYVDESCFTSQYYSEVFATVKNKEQYDVYSEEYIECVKTVGEKIESISHDSIDNRLAEVRLEYNQKIADGEKAYAQLESETNAQLKDALGKINQIEEYIENGDNNIASSKKQMEEKVTSAESQLKASKEKYEKSLAEYENNKSLANDAGNEIDGYNKAKEIYNNYRNKQEKDLQEIEKIRASVIVAADVKETARAEVEAAEGAYSSKASAVSVKEAELSQAQKNLQHYKDLEAEWTEESTTPLEEIKDAAEGYSKQVVRIKAELENLRVELSKADSAVAAAKAQYTEAVEAHTALEATLKSREQTYQSNEEVLNRYADDIKRLEEGEKNLDIFKGALEDASKELEVAKIEITESQLKLYYEKSKGSQKISAGEADLKSARSRLDTATQEYSAAEHDVKISLKKARGDIDKAKDFLKELNNSVWHISYQNDLPGHESYGQSLENITAMANVFPVFFFLIAALMSLVTMTRMVQEERMQLGTLKALGYGNSRILLKYYYYAALSCVAGAILGVAIGVVVFPKAINSAYSMMYNLPPVKLYFNWFYIACGVVFSLFATLSATLVACQRELRTQAATLMRPKSPKPGKRIFLERFTTLWNSMSFGSIVTIRNMFRSKKRMVMTILGVAGCTTLILAAFGISNSVDKIISAQYGEGGITHYNLMVVLDEEQIPGQSENIEEMKKDIRVKNAMLIDTNTVTAVSSEEGSDVELSAYVYVPENKDLLEQFISLRSRKTKNGISLTDEGAVITEKLAKDTKTDVGDTLVVKDSKGIEHSITVSAITENYVYHYIYLSPSYYRSVFSQQPKYEYITVIMENYTNINDEQALADDLLSYNSVTGVVSTEIMVDSFNTVVDRLDVVVVIFIIAAGLLALVILYNLTNISVQERLREIATIKVVGFTDAEVTAYVYRENIFYTVAGIILGLFGGSLLHKVVIDIAEVNVVMFGRSIYWWSYLLAVVITAAFVAIVSVLVHKRLQKFDVISALKSVE